VNGSVNGLSGNRLYKGYLALTLAMTDTFHGAPPRPSAQGEGPFAGWTLDLAPGGDGAGNQKSVEATWPITDTDTFAGTPWTMPVFRPIGVTPPDSAAIGHARASEPSLEEMRQGIRYRTLTLGFGLEGVNTPSNPDRGPARLVERTMQWLLDAPELAVATTAACVGAESALATHWRPSPGGAATRSRWDFGDGSPIAEVLGDTVAARHRFTQLGPSKVRVEVIDALDHHHVAAGSVMVGTCGSGYVYLPLLVQGVERP
jgi:hypothetical protein